MSVVATETYGEIQSILKECHKNWQLGVVRTGVGMGKSLAAKRYVAGSPKNSALVTLDPTSRSLTPGLTVLLDAFARLHERVFGRAPRRPSNLTYPYLIGREVDAMVGAIRRSSGDLLLVVDEAQYARHDFVESLRDFFDRGRFSLVLMGNHQFFDRQSRRLGPADFAALLSRAYHVLDRSEPTSKDVEAVAKYFAITSSAELELLASIAAAGGLREMIAVIEKAAAILPALGDKSFSMRALRIAARATGHSPIRAETFEGTA